MRGAPVTRDAIEERFAQFPNAKSYLTRAENSFWHQSSMANEYPNLRLTPPIIW